MNRAPIFPDDIVISPLEEALITQREERAVGENIKVKTTETVLSSSLYVHQSIDQHEQRDQLHRNKQEGDIEYEIDSKQRQYEKDLGQMGEPGNEIVYQKESEMGFHGQEYQDNSTVDHDYHGHQLIDLSKGEYNGGKDEQEVESVDGVNIRVEDCHGENGNVGYVDGRGWESSSVDSWNNIHGRDWYSNHESNLGHTSSEGEDLYHEHYYAKSEIGNHQVVEEAHREKIGEKIEIPTRNWDNVRVDIHLTDHTANSVGDRRPLKGSIDKTSIEAADLPSIPLEQQEFPQYQMLLNNIPFSKSQIVKHSEQPSTQTQPVVEQSQAFIFPLLHLQHGQGSQLATAEVTQVKVPSIMSLIPTKSNSGSLLQESEPFVTSQLNRIEDQTMNDQNIDVAMETVKIPISEKDVLEMEKEVKIVQISMREENQIIAKEDETKDSVYKTKENNPWKSQLKIPQTNSTLISPLRLILIHTSLDEESKCRRMQDLISLTQNNERLHEMMVDLIDYLK